MHMSPLPAPLLALTIAACSPTEPAREVRVIGNLASPADTALISLPSRAAVGIPVAIVVTTFGDGCYREGETEISRDALHVQITPFDYRWQGRDVICTSILLRFRHETLVTFDTRGEAVITIHGVQQPGDRPFVVTRQILIE